MCHAAVTPAGLHMGEGDIRETSLGHQVSSVNIFKNIQWISQRIQGIGLEAPSSQMPRRDFIFLGKRYVTATNAIRIKNHA